MYIEIKGNYMKDYKLLGNCQVCGRLQAVNRGMSKHGYTVEQGWFAGICSGQNELPMQQDDSVTLDVCESISDEIVELEKLVADLQSGKAKPKTAPIAAFYRAERVNFSEAPQRMQEYEIEKNICDIQFRIKSGALHIEYLMNVLSKVKGLELVKEVKAQKPAEIQKGEKRKDDKGVYVCSRVDGARIYWDKFVGDRVFKSWTGVSAWRKLELI